MSGQRELTMPGTLMARGRTAELYDWQPGQVLKLFFAWCPGDWIDREVAINRHLASSNLPIPRLLDVVEIDGRRGLIFERANGPTILRVITTKPWLLFNMAQLLAELHAAIHRLQITDLVPVRASLKALIERVDRLTDVQKAVILSRLGRLPDGDGLCHFDFHPDQAIITSRGPVIIDWMTAQRGDPAADVARTSLILGIGRVPYHSTLQSASLRLAQGLFRRRYLQRYLALNPQVSMAHIQAWTLPIAAARLREGIENEARPLLELIATELGSDDSDAYNYAAVDAREPRSSRGK